MKELQFPKIDRTKVIDKLNKLHNQQPTTNTENKTEIINRINKLHNNQAPPEEPLNPSEWSTLNLFKTLWSIWKGEKDWQGKLLGLYRTQTSKQKDNNEKDSN